MPYIVKLLLVLLGSLSISGIILLWITLDVSANKLYKDDMKKKMLSRKAKTISFVITSIVLFIIGYSVFI